MAIPDRCQSEKRALDVLTIFSDRCTIKFVRKEGGEVEMAHGHWCNECRSVGQLTTCIRSGLTNAQCRKDEELLAKFGKQKAFHTGSNSSCRQHIRSHYVLYKAWCAEREIPEHHHTLLRELLKAKQQVKKKGKEQPGIDEMLQHGASKRREFSRDDVMRAIAEFVVCDNQVSCWKGTVRRGLTWCLAESCCGQQARV